MDSPTVADVGRIAALADPVVRNLQITQCYHELAQALTAATGRGANWCAFATWASKQAGQTIRGEDLTRTVEDRLGRSPEVEVLLVSVQHALSSLGTRRDVRALRERLFAVLDPHVPLRRAGEAVARGNLKVFEEIAREFARFLALFEDGVPVDTERVRSFCAALRPGEPPDGQRLLRDAFMAYGEACAHPDPKTRAEQMFFANLLVGLHEQTRLQPEIAAAVDGSFGGTEDTRQRLLRAMLPGPWLRVRLRFARLLNGRLPLDVALDRLIGHVRDQVRRAVTEALLTLHLPSGRVLRLGRDLDAPLPAALAQPAHPKLVALLERVDPTPNSLAGSGTADWTDLPDRMHFIADFFRCYHEWEELFAPPFTLPQVAHLRAGRRPDGPL